MIKFSVIGNLGADAEVKVENGKKFVALSIAHTSTRTRDDGTRIETTTWVSATINGDGGRLLQYLKKGVKVYATGDGEPRMYHSEKQRSLVPGLKMFVRDIELINTNTDDVPRELYDALGVAHHVSKWYLADGFNEQAGELYDRRGQGYVVAKGGWVTPMSEQKNKVQEHEDKVF